MKIVSLIARFLLALVFIVFGANGLLQFMPMPELPHTPAGEFIRAMIVTHYIYAIALCQVIGGILLLFGRVVPLGLVILGPIVVNIVLYHLFMDPKGMAIALVVFVLWLFLLWRYRAAFTGLVRG